MADKKYSIVSLLALLTPLEMDDPHRITIDAVIGRAEDLWNYHYAEMAIGPHENAPFKEVTREELLGCCWNDEEAIWLMEHVPGMKET